MNDETYKKEISICQEMHKSQKGCNWGECEKCGVPLLLHKLYKGELIENKDEVQKFKKEILN